MRTVAIIQARMGSTRLPGKALMKLGGRTILARVVDRTTRVEGLNEILVATSTLPDDDMIERHCTEIGVGCYRGDPDDLLARYTGAAALTKADAILRVTADCPLIDREWNERILLTLPAHDYCAVSTRSVGLAQEAFTAVALRAANDRAAAPSDREHVVPFMIRNLCCRFIRPRSPLVGRWCVDTETDLIRLRRLLDYYPDLFSMGASQLSGIWR